MTRIGVRRWPRRLWPQKVRTRLTVIYAALFLAGGSALLGLTYALVAASLPAHQGPAKPALSRNQFIKLCKTPGPVKGGTSKPGPFPAKLADLCRSAYLQGDTAGAARQRDQALHNLLLFSAVGLGIMTIASAGAGWIVSGRVLRPVRAMTDTARRASDQHLGERISLKGAQDELKELADTFDDMLDRLDRAFSAQRRFVADASHELRTPLTVMRTAIDVTLAKPARTPAQLESMAVRVRGAVDRADALIDALLTLAVSDQGSLARREPFDLATAAEDSIDSAAAGIGRLGLQVQAELSPAETTGDPHLLGRLVGNLTDNAVRHNVPGGEVSIATGVRDGQAFLRIANSGPLVPADVIPSLFEPFRRLDGRSGTREGVGLGLAIARSVAAAHGATVEARSRPGGGLDLLVSMTASTAGPVPGHDA